MDITDIRLKIAAHPRIYQLVHPNPTPHLQDQTPSPQERNERKWRHADLYIYNNIDVFATLPYFLEAII